MVRGGKEVVRGGKEVVRGGKEVDIKVCKVV